MTLVLKNNRYDFCKLIEQIDKIVLKYILITKVNNKYLNANN